MILKTILLYNDNIIPAKNRNEKQKTDGKWEKIREKETKHLFFFKNRK